MKKLHSLLSVIILSLILCSSVFAADKIQAIGTGSITGKIAVKEKGAMPGGTVFFFNEASGPPPSATKYWRVPTHAFELDENGGFNAVLPEGKYYMGATRKLSGEKLGPPQDGDFFFINQDEKGNPKLHTIMQAKPVDVGVISEAQIFNRKSLVTEGITSIQGTVFDAKGSPVEGMLVFAFSTPTMIGIPLYVSDRSDKDGKYLLRLADGGTYYLRARASYGGGPPSAEQSMGIYKKGQPLIITAGEVKKGIDITAVKVGVSD